MGTVSPEGRRLLERWGSWVRELEDHPLDQFEYLGALEIRDEVEIWLNMSGDRAAADEVDDLDARFET